MKRDLLYNEGCKTSDGKLTKNTVVCLIDLRLRCSTIFGQWVLSDTLEVLKDKKLIQIHFQKRLIISC